MSSKQQTGPEQGAPSAAAGQGKDFPVAAQAPPQQPAQPAKSNQHLDQLLDEALDESFPASDPVAIGVDRPIRNDTDRRPGSGRNEQA